MTARPARITGIFLDRCSRTPGRHSFGDGLVMQTRASSREGEPPRASWTFRFQLRGRRRDLGLGPAGIVTLNEARERLLAARRLIERGIDPIDHRRAEEREVESSTNETFEVVAAEYISMQSPRWAKKADQAWRGTLAAYAFPTLGKKRCRDITTNDVLAILRPLWEDKKVATGIKLARRIAAVLDFARVKGLTDSFNPAQWRNHLDKALARPSTVRPVKHHAAVPHAQLNKIMNRLAKGDGMASLCLRFIALTASRATAATHARWDDIDLVQKIWTIPAAFSKIGKPVRIALSPQAVAVLKDAAQRRDTSGLVFPGWRHGRPLSLAGLVKALRVAGGDDATSHGLRASFSSWAAETGQNREAAEHALGHVVGSAVQRAYQRSDLLELRRPLMAAWGKHIVR